MNDDVRLRRLGAWIALYAIGPAGLAPASAAEEIVVTGTRIVERSVLDSTAPIDVLPAADLATTGAVAGELGQAIATLAPSFNFPRQSNSGTSDHVRAGQLRGMSPDQMLVLVNGKRRHASAVVNTETKIGRGTAAVDFNTIVLGAIRRIEILRDGGGAHYGSDAIAGVINVILDDRPQGARVDVTYGEHLTHEEAIDTTIDDGETVTVEASAGIPIAGEGFLRVGAEYQDRNATNRAGFDGVPFFIPQTPANLALQGRRNYAEGDPDVQDAKAWFHAGMPIGALQSYGFGTFGTRRTEGATFFRYPDESRNVPAIHPNGFLPVTTGDNTDASVTGGLRTRVGGWDADASLTWGRNEFEYGVRNSLNASLGAASPTRFDSGSYDAEHFTFNLDLTGERAVAFLARPVGIAFGFEYRRETYASRAGDPASFAAGPFDADIGAQGAPGLTPQDVRDAQRNVAGVYAELSSQVLDRLYVDLAGRYEYYDDFGSAANGKASAALTLAPGYHLRASVSSNLRAPSLSQTAFSDRTINFGVNRSLVTTRTIPVDDPIARALGARDLEPEQALDFSLGLTAQLDARTSLSIDGFHIRVDDRITLSDRLFGAGLAAFVQAQPGGAGIQSVRFFTNAIDTHTTGVDVVLRHARAFAGGDLTLTGAFNYASTAIADFKPTSARLLQLDPALRLVGSEEINTIESAAPQTRLVATGHWVRDDFDSTVRVSYYGSTVRVFNFGGGFEPRQEYGPEVSLDLQASYRFHRQGRITVGAVNILDNYPDPSDPAINFFGNLPYDILSPIGVNGRYLYARVSYTF
ncbi:MAG: TonB-dependent receptor plug domain-containing protein [Gammaproteobacteria bacterium]